MDPVFSTLPNTTTTPSEVSSIPELPVEIIHMILNNLSPADMEKARVCKAWKGFIDQACQIGPFIERGLRGQLSLREYKWTIQSLIRDRKDATNDDLIIQLCYEFRFHNLINKRFEVEGAKSFLFEPIETKVILGIAEAVIVDNKFFCQTLLSNTAIPGYLKEAAKTNSFATFIVGLIEQDQSTTNLISASTAGVAAATYILYLSTKSNEQLKLAATQGSSQANFTLGYCFDVVNQKYLTKAAESGNKIAQFSLGQALIQRNPVAATQWFGKSAIKGFIPSQFWLGKLLAENIEGADEYFKELSRLGFDLTHVEKGRKSMEQLLSQT